MSRDCDFWKIIIVHRRRPNINKCIELKLLEENLIQSTALQWGKYYEGNGLVFFTSGYKRPIRFKIIIAILEMSSFQFVKLIYQKKLTKQKITDGTRMTIRVPPVK